MKTILAFFFALFLLPSFAQKNSRLTLHEYSAPDHLNPLTATSNQSQHLLQHLYGSLLEYHPQTLTLRPQLALARPQIARPKSGTYAGGMSLAYEIRPEAVWDDGKPITGHDFVFTLKALLNPHLAAGVVRAQYAFIEEVEVDAANPRRFTIYAREGHFLAESLTGELMILPEHIYDPQALLRPYPLQRLLHPADPQELLAETPLMDFADWLHACDQLGEDSLLVSGSGAYTPIKWLPGKEWTLERKANWWGDRLPQDTALHAYPQQLVYKIIPYYDAAVLSLVNKELDVMRGLKPQTFLELQKNRDFTKDYALYATDQLAYYSLAFNLQNPKLSDKRVREAIAHLFQRDELKKLAFQGLASTTNSPINPHKPHYNHQLADLPYSTENAAALLDKAGWKDSDKDGIRDKMVDGQKLSLRLQYKYNKGNTARLQIGLYLQQQAAAVGIQIELIEREWTELLADMQQRNYELCCLTWLQGHGLDDMRPVWHSSSDSPDGSNRTGFRSPAADKLIEAIEVEMDETKRLDLYRQLQTQLFQEYPCVFLFVPQECWTVHRRFSGVVPSYMRPSYQERYFRE